MNVKNDFIGFSKRFLKSLAPIAAPVPHVPDGSWRSFVWSLRYNAEFRAEIGMIMLFFGTIGAMAVYLLQG